MKALTVDLHQFSTSNAQFRTGIFVYLVVHVDGTWSLQTSIVSDIVAGLKGSLRGVCRRYEHIKLFYEMQKTELFKSVDTLSRC